MDDKKMTPLEVWGIISAKLIEYYRLRRTDTFNGYFEKDLEAEVICFNALRVMHEMMRNDG